MYLPVTVGSFCVAVLADLDAAVPLGTGNDCRWYFSKARLLGHVLDLASAKARHASGLTARETSGRRAAGSPPGLSFRGADRVRSRSSRQSCKPGGWPVSGAAGRHPSAALPARPQ